VVLFQSPLWPIRKTKRNESKMNMFDELSGIAAELHKSAERLREIAKLIEETNEMQKKSNEKLIEANMALRKAFRLDEKPMVQEDNITIPENISLN
jgi:hypothetical protein